MPPDHASIVRGQLEDYLIIQRLQDSLYGNVMAGVGLLTGDACAVKVLRSTSVDAKNADKSLPETPLAEVFFAPVLHGCKNFTKVREAIDCGDSHYVISIFANGEDLLELLKQHPNGLSEEYTSVLIRKATDGLLACHLRNVALQDFSLENCLLSYDADGMCHVHLCDPGQAVVFRLEAETGREVPVPYRGCIGKKFRPPEIFDKRPYLATKVDAWCLGWSTFYLLFATEIFESVHPADRDKNWELFTTGRHKELFAALEIAADTVSPLAKHFVFRLLDPDPNKRMSVSEARKHPFLTKFEGRGLHKSKLPRAERFEEGDIGSVLLHCVSVTPEEQRVRLLRSFSLIMDELWSALEERGLTAEIQSIENRAKQARNELKVKGPFIPKRYYSKLLPLYCGPHKPSHSLIEHFPVEKSPRPLFGTTVFRRLDSARRSARLSPRHHTINPPFSSDAPLTDRNADRRETFRPSFRNESFRPNDTNELNDHPRAGPAPGRADPQPANPARADCGRGDYGRGDGGRGEGGRGEGGRQDGQRGDGGRLDSIRGDPGRLDPGRPDPARPDSTRPEQPWPDQVWRPDWPNRPELNRSDPGDPIKLCRGESFRGEVESRVDLCRVEVGREKHRTAAAKFEPSARATLEAGALSEFDKPKHTSSLSDGRKARDPSGTSSSDGLLDFPGHKSILVGERQAYGSAASEERGPNAAGEDPVARPTAPSWIAGQSSHGGWTSSQSRVSTTVTGVFRSLEDRIFPSLPPSWSKAPQWKTEAEVGRGIRRNPNPTMWTTASRLWAPIPKPVTHEGIRVWPAESARHSRVPRSTQLEEPNFTSHPPPQFQHHRGGSSEMKSTPDVYRSAMADFLRGQRMAPWAGQDVPATFTTAYCGDRYVIDGPVERLSSSQTPAWRSPQSARRLAPVGEGSFTRGGEPATSRPDRSAIAQQLLGNPLTRAAKRPPPMPAGSVWLSDSLIWESQLRTVPGGRS